MNTPYVIVRLSHRVKYDMFGRNKSIGDFHPLILNAHSAFGEQAYRQWIATVFRC